jgi:hypothetical protein
LKSKKRAKMLGFSVNIGYTSGNARYPQFGQPCYYR